MIIEYDKHYVRAIADLFHLAVHSISDDIYTPEQKLAWAPEPPDYSAWGLRLEQKKPFLFIDSDEVCGFIELEADGHIDCFYVHPKYQKKGVGMMLYRHIEQYARDHEYPSLHVEASIIAKPFFEKVGFRMIRQNVVRREGSELINFSMEKGMEI